MPSKLSKRYNLCVVTRTFMKDNVEKKNYERIGQLLQFEGDDGQKWFSIDLYHMPGVKVSVFEKTEAMLDN